MSLLSQEDRELAIEALKNYSYKIDQQIFDNPHQRETLQQKKNQIVTLLNWIKLEYFKNEN